ncbi:MAG: NAD(P)H-dependent glycerol-3-phosphate dehydrogenase, partial [Gammaproteobacteria bacterium]
MNITVFGAGAWGTAVAAHMSLAHDVVLWGRDVAVLQSIASQRENPRYLAGIKLSPTLKVQSDFSVAARHGLAQSDALWVLGTPMGALRQTLLQLLEIAPIEQWPALVWLCKGFEVGTGQMPHQVVEEVLGKPYGGALTGPSFAAEVARGLPCALTAASADELTRQAMVRAAHHAALRVYELDDLVGAEVGGAVKNIMAVATGICDGMQLGLNARAALITRGMAEIKRLAVALGAQAETLNGLSGFGDLILTCTGDLSRNRRVGLMLAQGKSLDTILKELGQVAEGVKCAPVVKQLAADLG